MKQEPAICPKHIVCALDPNGLIKAVKNISNKSSPLIKDVVRTLCQLSRETGCTVQVFWTPGHCASKINDYPDLLADFADRAKNVVTREKVITTSCLKKWIYAKIERAGKHPGYQHIPLSPYFKERKGYMGKFPTKVGTFRSKKMERFYLTLWMGTSNMLWGATTGCEREKSKAKYSKCPHCKQDIQTGVDHFFQCASQDAARIRKESGEFKTDFPTRYEIWKLIKRKPTETVRLLADLDAKMKIITDKMAAAATAKFKDTKQELKFKSEKPQRRGEKPNVNLSWLDFGGDEERNPYKNIVEEIKASKKLKGEEEEESEDEMDWAWANGGGQQLNMNASEEGDDDFLGDVDEYAGMDFS